MPPSFAISSSPRAGATTTAQHTHEAVKKEFREAAQKKKVKNEKEFTTSKNWQTIIQSKRARFLCFIAASLL